MPNYLNRSNKISVWAKMKSHPNIVREYSFRDHGVSKLEAPDTENTQYILSEVYPNAIDFVIHSIHIKNDDMIVCPIYKNSNDSKFSIWNPLPVCNGYPTFDFFDIQIGVTGTMKTNETPFESFGRETSEEIGFSGEPDKIFNPIVQGMATWYPFSCKLNTTPVYSDYNNKSDIRNSKIACIVYGSSKDAYTFLSRLDIKKIDPNSSDGIVGVGLMRVDDARNFK